MNTFVIGSSFLDVLETECEFEGVPDNNYVRPVEHKHDHTYNHNDDCYTSSDTFDLMYGIDFF